MTELEQIETEIKQCEEILEDKVRLERLYKNEDFTKIILKGYLEEECQRTVGMMADPRYREEGASMLTGMAHFRKHLNTLEQFFSSAEARLEELRQTQLELLVNEE